MEKKSIPCNKFPKKKILAKIKMGQGKLAAPGKVNGERTGDLVKKTTKYMDKMRGKYH